MVGAVEFQVRDHVAWITPARPSSDSATGHAARRGILTFGSGSGVLRRSP